MARHTRFGLKRNRSGLAASGNRKSTGNLVACRIKDEDAYFLSLPVAIRRALQEAPVNFTLNGLKAKIAKHGEAKVLAWILDACVRRARQNAAHFYGVDHPNATMEVWTPVAPRVGAIVAPVIAAPPAPAVAPIIAKPVTDRSAAAKKAWVTIRAKRAAARQDAQAA